jgi:hypothetical protein
MASLLPLNASSAGPEPEIDGLILREDSNVIVTVWQGAVTGEIAVHHMETTGNITVSWLDPDSTEFNLDPQLFELQAEIADPAIASYQQIGDWSFTITGLEEGATDLVLKVWHIVEQHYDFISPPVPLHVEEEHIVPDGLRLREGGEVLVTVWQGDVSGEVLVGNGRTSGPIDIAFLNADGEEFVPSDPDFELQLPVGNATVASLTPTGAWSFQAHGNGPGQTTFQVVIFHVDHTDFSSPPIPIRVINLAVGIPEPDLQATWGRARLLPAHPNPFNPSTLIRYELVRETEVDLSIYDLEGRLVTRLESGPQGTGIHVIRWNAERFASGAYLVRLKTPQEVRVEKIVLAK